MNVRMTPPQGPMGQPMPMGGAPAPMPPMGGPMPVPPMQPTAGQQQKQGLGSAFGGSAQGRGQFKNFMSAKKQTSALVPPMQASMQPMGSAPPMAQPRMAPQPMLPAPSPQMMGAMKPMGAPQMGGPVQAGRPMRGTQGGLGSAPVQLNMGGVVPQLSMGMAASGPAVYLGDDRLSDPADMHQKMLRAGYGRDEIMDSASGIRDAAMHIVEDTDEYLGGARSGFGHVHEFADGGEVPRQTTIAGQPHYLAYINPEEGELLEGLGGAGKPGPGGIPSYWFHSGWGGGGSSSSSSSSSSSNDDDDGGFSFSDWASDTWAEITSGGEAVTDTYNSGDNASTSTSTGTDFSFMDADDEEDYNLGTGTDYSTAYDPFSNDDDDDGPSTTVVTGSSGYPSLDATANVNVDSPSTDYSFMDSDEEEDFNLGTGTTYDTVYDPFPADDDSEPVDTGGYDAVGTGSVDDPAVGGGTDYSFLDSDEEEDFNLGTGATYDDTYDSGSVVVGGSDDGPSYPDTPPPSVSPPAPPPVYYDMFGGEHATQEAANEADAAYTAASNAVDIVTGGTTGGTTGTDVDVDTGFTQQEIDASNNTAKLMNDYSAISNDYSTFQGNDLTKGSGNTIGYATGGSKAGYAAIINPVTGGIDILTPGSESVEASFAAEELEDALNYLTDGDVDLTNLDAPLDLIPEASGGTGTVGLDAEGRLIEYGVDDIEEMLSQLEGMSDMTEEELAAIAGDTPIETEFEVFPTADGVVTRDEIEADLAARDAISNIVDPEEDFNLFPEGDGLESASVDLPTGPFVDSELTGLEQFEEDLYNDETSDVVPDFLVGKTEQELEEINKAAEAFQEGGTEGLLDYRMDMSSVDPVDYGDRNLDLADIGNEFSAGEISEGEMERLISEAEAVLNIRDPEEDTMLFPEDEEEDIVTEVTGETGQTATEAYLSAMTKLDNPETMTEMEQRALYGARGQVPNAAETAYLTSLLRDARHKEDVVNPETGQVIAKAGDYVVKQTGGEKFEDLIVKGIDFFLNPLTILGDKYSLESMNEAYVQEQLDAYRNGGTFVYDGAGTVVGIADANYDADGDGENDSVVLLGDDGEYTVTGGRIGVEDVENSNANADDDADIDDIDIVDSNVTYTNTEDGVVEQRVGGDEEQTGGDDPIDPCPEGFMLDPVLGECVPIDDVTSGSPSLSLQEIIRDTGGGDDGGGTTFVVGDPLIIRAPQQFARGGPVDLDPNTYDFRGFDEDNPFNMSSVLAMQRHQVGLTPFDESQMELYDLNRDGSITEADTTAGLQYLTYSPDGVFDEQRANEQDFYLYTPPITLGARPTQQATTPSPVTQPVQQPVQGMAVRKPKQFNRGGPVTPNIDRFMQSLGA